MTTSDPLVLTANHAALREIKPWLVSVLSDVDSSTLGSIELAVHELATNSVDHSGAVNETVTLTAFRDQAGLKVELQDNGKPFEPSAVAAPDPNVPQERGYGLMIIDQLADDLQYRRDGDTNVWAATFSW